jgi:hypothetical protein
LTWAQFGDSEDSTAFDCLLQALQEAQNAQPQQQQPPTGQQLLQPEEAASLVRAALHSRNDKFLQVFCEQLQQLQLLPGDAVVALLQEAVELGAWGALRCMRCSLPGAVQVMEAGLVQGLQELISLHDQMHST